MSFLNRYRHSPSCCSQQPRYVIVAEIQTNSLDEEQKVTVRMADISVLTYCHSLLCVCPPSRRQQWRRSRTVMRYKWSCGRMTVGWVPHCHGSRGCHYGVQEQGCDTASREGLSSKLPLQAASSWFLQASIKWQQPLPSTSFRIHPYKHTFRIQKLFTWRSFDKSRRKSVIVGWTVVFTLYCWSKA